MTGARLMLPPGWTPSEDEQIAAYRIDPTMARAWIEHGATEPVMLEMDGDDVTISEPPAKVAGWLKTMLFMEGLKVPA